MAGPLPRAGARGDASCGGEYWWSAQYQQRPSPAGGGIFKRGWFRTFVNLGDGYQLGDTLIPTNDLLMVDLVRERLEAPDILPALRRASEGVMAGRRDQRPL